LMECRSARAGRRGKAVFLPCRYAPIGRQLALGHRRLAVSGHVLCGTRNRALR